MIIALAGHVDHGKTSLVRALTGTDPSRLPDERRRGMTIDLGFANTTLPDGAEVGFVDVPGHERFLGNMLAGVLSIDAALLVIAADDGPMPQTREHLAILGLTGIADLTVVVTKIDRVGADDLPPLIETVRALAARHGYPDAPVLAVSSQTGAGMEALAAHLGAKAAAWRPRSAAGGFRLSIDRVFSVTGTGVVVTGTVAAGAVSLGDRLLLGPAGLGARVRGIQRHHAQAETARAGDRCALAIAGPRVTREAIRRGDWLVAEHLHHPTQRIDARVRATADRDLAHGARVHAHLGAASLPARALVLGARDLEADQEGFVSLRLDHPTMALFGDRVVLRDDSTGRVVAGGTVVDPFSPARRVRRETRAAVLAALAPSDPALAVEGLLATEGWVDLTHLALARNAAIPPVRAAADPITVDGRQVLVSGERRAETEALLTERLARWHASHPSLPGPTKVMLLSVASTLPASLLEAILQGMIERGLVIRQARALSLPDHRPVLAPADRALWDSLEPRLIEAGPRPPRVRELAQELGMDPAEAEQCLVRLERFGLLVRVAPNRFFRPETVVELGELAARLATGQETAGFTAGMFNQASGIGRNLTIQVLEYLDRIGVTQRAGEFRLLRRSAASVLE